MCTHASIILCKTTYVDTCSHDHLDTLGERQTRGALSDKLILCVSVCVCFDVIGLGNLSFSWFLPGEGLPGVGDEY